MAVVGFDLTGFQDQEAKFIFQGAIVGGIVKEAMLGQDEAVKRNLFSLDPLAVVFDLGPAVIGDDGMTVKIKNHASTKRGTPNPSPVGTKSMTTSIPISTVSGSQPTILVMRRGPSSRSTYAST